MIRGGGGVRLIRGILTHGISARGILAHGILARGILAHDVPRITDGGEMENFATYMSQNSMWKYSMCRNLGNAP